MSGPNLRWVSSCVKRATQRWAEGGSTEEIDILAGLGASGKYPGNARRDLLRAFCRNAIVPKPLTIETWAKHRLNEHVVSDHSVLSFPDVLESVWEHHQGVFYEVMGRGPELFWSALDA